MKEKYLRALVKLTRAASQPTIEATIDHLANGLTQGDAAERYGVKQEAVARFSKRLKELDKTVEELNLIKNNS
jgi:hypothetical protein